MKLNLKHHGFAALLLSLSLSTLAFAGSDTPANAPAAAVKGDHWAGGSKATCKSHREGREKMAQTLGLSADQKSKIEAIRKDFRTAHKSEFEAKRAQYQELKSLKASGASADQIKAKREALHQQFGNMKAEHEKMDSQIKAVLTPEQAQKWDAMHAEWRQNHQQKHEQSKAGQKS